KEMTESVVEVKNLKKSYGRGD
ncbi:hypothetical protein LCGC14_1767980, partial [marine sediment metagenome]